MALTRLLLGLLFLLSPCGFSYAGVNIAAHVRSESVSSAKASEVAQQDNAETPRSDTSEQKERQYRQRVGYAVLAYLLILFILTYLLKKEVWKDVTRKKIKKH